MTPDEQARFEELSRRLTTMSDKVGELLTRLDGLPLPKMTVSQVARYLGYKEKIIYNMVHERRIPHSILTEGGHPRFDQKEIDAWFKRRKVKTDDELELLANTRKTA